MHPYSISIHSKAFWNGIASRVTPLIGDVATRLGKSWMDQVEHRFNRNDFFTVAAAREAQAPLPQWHVLTWHSAPDEMVRDDDGVVAGTSREECLAHLLGRCSEFGVWPTQIIKDPASERVLFVASRGVIASIGRVAPSKRISDEVRSRAEGVLLGLRKAASPDAELAKRVARWPGLGEVGAEERDARDVHWPCPTEWLLSARLLLEEAGFRDAPTSQAQALAAAILDQPSWNHLCGLRGPEMPKSAWWTVGAPYVVRDSAEEGPPSAVYGDAVEAFIELARRSSEALGAAAWLGASVKLGSTLSRAPYIEMRDRRSIPDSIVDPIARLSAEYERGYVAMFPVNRAQYEDVWLHRVEVAMKRGIDDGLSELFQIGASFDSRQAFGDAEHQRIEVARDGQWRFTIDVDPELSLENRFLRAELWSEGMAEKVGTAHVPLYKGAINRLGDAYVLTGDYDMGAPEAIVKGIAESTARKIADLLAEAGHERSLRYDYRQMVELGIRKDELDLLESRMTPNGAVSPF